MADIALYSLLIVLGFAGILWGIDLWRAKYPPKQTHR